MEKEIVKEYLDLLLNDFNIYIEVTGKSKISGKQKRIDAVIIAKEYPNLKFGIEFKRLDLGAFNNFTSWLKQSIIYSQCEFDVFGKLPILYAPSINYGNKEQQFMFSRIAGEFGLGEISKEYYKVYNKNIYKIKIKDTVLWSSHSGFNKAYLKTDFKSHLEL